MTLNELIAQVYIKTNRPDLEEQTRQAIVSSTLAMHTMDSFYKDIVTARLVFENANYIQLVDTTEFERWRSLSYFRKNNPDFDAYQQNPLTLPVQDYYNRTKFMQVLTPDDILDSYGIEKVDVFYQAGTSIYMKSSTSLRFGLLGFYQYPNVSIEDDGANFSSWIADEYPFSIIYDATSNILQSIGMTDAARKYDQPEVGLVAVQKKILIMNNIIPVGS